MGEVRNIAVEIKGSARDQEIVVVGAHYDSAHGAPGANDNGSGSAALLELARILKSVKSVRTIRLVWFVNEEPPYFHTEQMGSVVYAERLSASGKKVAAMLSLETMGYFSEESNSQNYPPIIKWLYPDKGNFIGFVGNFASRDLLHNSLTAFRSSGTIPSEGAVLPEFIPGAGWSDHWSFWREGYPAIMITDTAIFRYPYYHTEQDTSDKIDYSRLAKVITGLEVVIKRLAAAS